MEKRKGSRGLRGISSSPHLTTGARSSASSTVACLRIRFWSLLHHLDQIDGLPKWSTWWHPSDGFKPPISIFTIKSFEYWQGKRVQKPWKYLFLALLCISFYLNKVGPMYQISTYWACSTHDPQAVWLGVATTVTQQRKVNLHKGWGGGFCFCFSNSSAWFSYKLHRWKCDVMRSKGWMVWLHRLCITVRLPVALLEWSVAALRLSCAML